MSLNCPRDGAELTVNHEHGIEIDRCATCGGAWYDEDELAALESTVAGDEERLGTIDYARRGGDLRCPVCGAAMLAFNYRAYNLELDACPERHGFWLDAGESARVRDIMKERVRGLARSRSAQRAWQRARGRGGSGGVFGTLKDLFRRR